MVEKQIHLIRKMDWDYLIILDACRYDYFEKVYREYIKEGKLRKVLSSGSSTEEWLNKTFRNKIDVLYISGNPHINSKGLLKEKFDARKYFTEIIDAWKIAWDDKLDTVHPKDINSIVKENISKKQKIIIHYMQPHAPFIPMKEKRYEGNVLHILGHIFKKILPKETKIRLLFSGKGNKILKVLPKIYQKLNLGVTYKNILEYEKKNISKYYLENLEFVLKYVKELVEFIPSGKIVITADHGELLGEDGKYGHPGNFRHPKLLEVPWLEIDKGRKKVEEEFEGKKEEEEEEEYSKKDEEIIKEKLRALGYLE